MQKKRWLSLLLCLFLTFCGCTSKFTNIVDNYIGKTTAPFVLAFPKAREKTTPHYQSLTYNRPDIDLMLEKVEKAEGLLKANDIFGAFEAYDELLYNYDFLITMYCYAQLQLDLNVFDEFYAKEVPKLIEDLLKYEMALDRFSSALIDAGYQKELDRHYGKNFSKQIKLNAQRSNETVSNLYHQDKELSNEYNRLRVGFTIEHNNQEWSYDELVNSPDYTDLRLQYCDEFSATVWSIFDQMRSIRNETAKVLGYSSYAEYQYESYSRDYSPEQAKLLYASVKEHVVPLFSKLLREYFTLDINGLYEERFPFWETLETLHPMMDSFSKDLSSALNVMLERGLYDTEERSSKRVGAYTTELRSYAAPFLFMYWNDTYDSVTTFIHEMGHFSSSNQNQEGYSYCQYEPLDLFEIESQGLETLFIHYYDELFRHSKEAAFSTILNLLYALIAGCMEDEFQQAFYADPAMGYDEVCALYARLGEEYGLTENYVFEDTSWSLIPHTFTSPLYYFSYAISAIPSLELFSMAQKDFDAAKSTYQKLLHRDKNASLLETLKHCGLKDPFEAETVKEICDFLAEYFKA